MAGRKPAIGVSGPMVRKLRPPFAPMEALSVDEVPAGPEWQYEPKWDGFRCLVFRDGDTITLQSKSGKPLTRYFPDVVEAVRALDRPSTFVLDGEIVVPEGKVFSFDALLQRIHPAASRVQKLADGNAGAADRVRSARRRRRHRAGRRAADRRAASGWRRSRASISRSSGRVRLSPATTKLADAKKWLTRVGATLDGIIAKRRDLPYRAGDRTGMQKIKNYRSADCVVGGFRYNEGKPVVGSLLLGLYDDDGMLNHVGFTSSIAREDKPALTKKLEKLIAPPGFTGNAPGGPSRWSTARSAEWQPLKPKLVVEVSYDHFSGDRFRHGTRLMRWRPDKAPEQCTMDQVAQKKAELDDAAEMSHALTGGVPFCASTSPAR